MKKILTQENLIGFGVAILAGFVAIAIFYRGPAKLRSIVSGVK
jgi:hypothetical protein